MNFRRPPALANWLLDRLGPTRQNAALAGDLLEDFRNGRSAGWYWRQTLRAIASGTASHARIMRPYLTVLAAAYAVQLAIVLPLWSKHAPPPVIGGGWIKFGVWLLLQIAFTALAGFVNRRAVGESSPDIKAMYCALEVGSPRSGILAVAAWQSFFRGFASYCICALVFPRFSLAGLLSVEITWFVLWVFTPALLPLAPSKAAETEECDDESSPELLPPEPNLPVVLSGGSTVILRRQDFAQSVFAAADPELIAVLFSHSRSLEILHRAIWLGACRRQSLTPAELADLIHQAERPAPAAEAIPSNRKETLRQRLRLTFRGDPFQNHL